MNNVNSKAAEQRQNHQTHKLIASGEQLMKVAVNNTLIFTPPRIAPLPFLEIYI